MHICTVTHTHAFFPILCNVLISSTRIVARLTVDTHTFLTVYSSIITNYIMAMPNNYHEIQYNNRLNVYYDRKSSLYTCVLKICIAIHLLHGHGIDSSWYNNSTVQNEGKKVERE